MTKQEIFNKVASHLLKQNKKSYLPSDYVCAYRGEDNCKCAIGILIPDDKYDPYLEGKTVSNPDVLKAFEEGIDIENPEMLGFLSALQSIHDLYIVTEWKGRLRYVAKDYGLSFEVLGG